MTNPVLRMVLQKVNANAAEAERLAAQVQQHGATMNSHAAELERQREVGQMLVAAIEVLDRKLERILLKLERRDG